MTEEDLEVDLDEIDDAEFCFWCPVCLEPAELAIDEFEGCGCDDCEEAECWTVCDPINGIRMGEGKSQQKN